MAELSTPVRGVLPATDIALSGIGQVGYGITVGSTAANEDWLVEGGTQGGIWTLTYGANTWARRSDLDTSGEFANMPSVRAREGNQGVAGSLWYYSGIPVPTFGTTNLVWTLGAYGRPALAGGGLQSNYPYIEMDDSVVTAGYYYAPGLYVDGTGRTTQVFTEAVGTGFITGLELYSINSLFQINITPGYAWVPGLGRLVRLPILYQSSATVTANILFYFTLTDTGSGGVIERWNSTANPLTIYSGTAARLTSDDTRRYLGSAKADANGRFVGFTIDRITGLYTYAAGTAVASASSATTEQTVDIARGATPAANRLAPQTSKMARVSLTETTATQVVFGNPEDGITLSSSVYLVTTVTGVSVYDIPLSSDQRFSWLNPTGTGTVTVTVLGYYEARG